MVIGAINSVSFSNTYKPCSFNGKGTKQENDNNYNDFNISESPRVPVSRKLAVPLAATVLAMSPMSTGAVVERNFENDDMNEIELFEPAGDVEKVLMHKTLLDPQNAFYQGSSISLLSTDSNDKTVEKVKFLQSRGRFQYDATISKLVCKEMVVKDAIDEHVIEKKTIYSAIGTAEKYFTIEDTPKHMHQPKYVTTISKELFVFLNNLANDPKRNNGAIVPATYETIIKYE